PARSRARTSARWAGSSYGSCVSSRSRQRTVASSSPWSAYASARQRRTVRYVARAPSRDAGAAGLAVRLPGRKRLAAAAARAGTGTGTATAGAAGVGVGTAVAGQDAAVDSADEVTRLGQRVRGRGDAREEVPARLRFGPGVGAVGG